MEFYRIEKDKLVNLEYSLKRELFRANNNGTYTSTTIVGCNTRKYHGLLVWPKAEDDYRVLLSGINETIEQYGDEFRIGINKYPEGIYDPHGHRYLREMSYAPVPTKIYRVGGVILKKQRVLSSDEDRILTKYTIVDAHSPTKLKIQPFLAFRNVHELSHANMDAETAVQHSDNGVRHRMYSDYPYLYMQTNIKNKFVHAPDWNYNNEYEKEQLREYEYSEDLFTPGYFVLDVKKGTEVIFAVGLKKTSSRGLKQQFTKEVKIRKAPGNFEESLRDASKQFIIKSGKKKRLRAGFHWSSSQYSENLISLPGLCLTNKDYKTYEELLDSEISSFKSEKNIMQADIPLYFFYAIQYYNESLNKDDVIWNKYGGFLTSIIKKFKQGYAGTIVHDNGMLYAPETNIPVCKMNEVIDGKPVVKRTGFLNDINALWYNALMFYTELAEANNDKKALKFVGNLPDKINHFYSEVFWNEDDKNLYDYVYNSSQNTDVRPNQVFAASLCYSPISDSQKQAVLKNIRSELLTDRGLRSLSPKNPDYIGTYSGGETNRKKAKHQGTVHPWLIGAFCEAWLKLHKEAGLNFVKEIYNGFKDEIYRGGIGTISELYDGNPPYEPKGAISYAPSVAELLRINKMIENTERLK